MNYSVLDFQPFQLRTACGTVHQTHQTIWAADIWLGSTDHQRSIPGHCFNGFLWRFDSGKKKREVQNWRKKNTWEKKNKILICLKIWPLWDLKPQAFPGFLRQLWDAKIRKSAKKTLDLSNPKKLKRNVLVSSKPQKPCPEEVLIYTGEPHFCVFLMVSSLLCKAPFSFLCSKNPRSIHRKFMSALFSTFTLVEMQSCFHLRGFGSQIQRQKIGITLWNFETAPQ